MRAAGCVVWRRHDDGIEILVVHRPRYDDWSLPKGKLDPGETELECAVREVEEETGFVGAVGDELSTVAYVDHKNRPKTVRYWMLELGGGVFTPNEEVDRIWGLRQGAVDYLVKPVSEDELVDKANAALAR